MAAQELLLQVPVAHGVARDMGFEPTTFSLGNDPQPKRHADFRVASGEEHVSTCLRASPVDAAQV